MLTTRSAFALLALAAPLLVSAPALAAGDDKDKPAADKDAKKDDAKKDDGDKKDADKKDGEGGDKFDPYEDPNKTYRFIGLRFRDAIAPKFIMNWFADGGRNVNVAMVGPEFITRRDHLELAVALMYADYSMDPFLFKGKSEPDTSFELVASGIKIIYGMLDVMYEVPIEKKGDKTGRFAFLVGGGVGIGAVAGPLWRSQAYPKKAGASPNNPQDWGICTGVNTPNAAYCENPNGHFSPGGKDITAKDSYSEPYWSAGGSKPMIFPWIALPQFSFRYKPIKQFQTKLDLGFSTTGFFFGLSASYGL
jgi:hypothetical protein